MKNDRIAKNFYEIYRYSRVDRKEYEDLVTGIFDGKWDSSTIASLKGMSKPMQYGITSFCFDEISRKVGEAFEEHEFLQKIRTGIRSGDGVQETLFTEEGKVPRRYADEVKRIEYEVSKDAREQTMKDFHNAQVVELKNTMSTVASVGEMTEIYHTLEEQYNLFVKMVNDRSSETERMRESNAFKLLRSSNKHCRNIQHRRTVI